MRNAAHGDRLYQTELIKRSIRFELPRWPRVERALTVLLGSALGVTVPMLIAIATCRLLLMLSPDMPARASFRRSIGMAGYAIMPTTVQFSAMILSVAFSFFEPRRNPFGPSASLAGCCGILALLWTGVLMATLPWITLPDRDTARRITCGIVMLIAYWTPFAIAMSR